MVALGIKKIKGHYYCRIDSAKTGIEADNKAMLLRREGKKIQVIKTKFGWDLYAEVLKCA